MGRSLAVVLAVALLPLAGCASEAPAAEVNLSATDDPAAPDVPPDGLSAFRETNRTETGIGGMAHDHDYWKGRDRVELFSYDTLVFPFPVLGRDDEVGSQSQDLQPAGTALVYEGTAQVEVLVKDPLLYPGLVAHPAPPTMRLLYLTAADGALDWRDAGDVVYGTPVVIPVTEKEVDMPHSLASLWRFRLESPGSHLFDLNITATSVRGEDVPVWPGHPDFYADSPKRLVMDADGSTREPGLGESLVRDAFYDYVHPDRLISWGSTSLDVFVNVTRVAGPGGQDPRFLYLRVLNATSQSDDTFQVEGTDGTARSFQFTVPVDAEGMDSPYAPSSRWGFAMGAAYGLFSDDTPYELDYHITVVAHGDSDTKPQEAAGTAL